MKIFKILIFIFCFKISFSQNNYIGTIILNNNQVMSFKLELVEQDGIVNGYSMTNIGLENETKSEVFGLYFKSSRTFQLREKKIIYTNSEEPLNTFCYINMSLSYKGRFGRKHLEGEFIGNFLDSTECARGRIILIKEKKIKKKIKKIHNEKKKQEREINYLQETRILKEGDDLTIEWKGDEIILFIWDNNEEDKDEIQVKINNTIILDNFETKNKKKKIQYKLKKGTNIIEILAKNEGTSPPNTSKIELIDNKIKYPIITQLKLKESILIKIIK